MHLTRFVFAVFALSAFAAGDSIDYASAGSLSQHTVTIVGSIAAGKTWSVTDELVDINDTTTGKDAMGQLGKVDITSGLLVKTATGFSFTGGDVKITDNAGVTLIDDVFSSGTITKLGGVTFLNATFAGGGTTEIESQSGVFSSNTIVGVTPEVPSLFLMGTGLVGIWWLGRTKLIEIGKRNVAMDETAGQVSAE